MVQSITADLGLFHLGVTFALNHEKQSPNGFYMYNDIY